MMKLQNHDQTKRIKNVFLDYDKLKQFDDIILDAIKQSSRKITYSKDVKFLIIRISVLSLSPLTRLEGEKYTSCTFRLESMILTITLVYIFIPQIRSF